MRIVQIYLIIYFYFFLYSLNGQTSDNVFIINDIESVGQAFVPLYNSDSIGLDSLTGEFFFNIYYLNGDCSLCLNKMKKADTFFKEFENKELKTIFIVDTEDTISFGFHRDRYNITRIVLWDRDKRLIDKELNTCFLIDKSGNIIIEGDFINDKITQNKYKETIEHIITSR